MTGREKANIFWYLFGWYKFRGRRGWRGKRLFDKTFWTRTSPYIWQDTFSTPFNRLIGCKLLGHRNVIEQLRYDSYNVEDKTVQHCFNCYRDIEGWFTYNCRHCKLASSWPLKKKGLYLECPHCKIRTIISRSR